MSTNRSIRLFFNIKSVNTMSDALCIFFRNTSIIYQATLYQNDCLRNASLSSIPNALRDCKTVGLINFHRKIFAEIFISKQKNFQIRQAAKAGFQKFINRL